MLTYQSFQQVKHQTVIVEVLTRLHSPAYNLVKKQISIYLSKQVSYALFPIFIDIAVGIYTLISLSEIISTTCSGLNMIHCYKSVGRNLTIVA